MATLRPTSAGPGPGGRVDGAGRSRAGGRPRSLLTVVLSALLGSLVLGPLAAPAQAEEGFQYWNYFHLDGDGWAFSDVGPADHQPEDGDVEGLRFGTSTVSRGIVPRADLDDVSFDTVCADVAAEQGQKRVAVVLDYGTEEAPGTRPDPRATCAVVSQAASTQQVLDEVADVRIEGGMVCAIDGYPASGCGTPVEDAQVAETEPPVTFALPAAQSDEQAGAQAGAQTADDGGTAGWALVGVAALVLLIVVAGVVLARRRRTA